MSSHKTGNGGRRNSSENYQNFGKTSICSDWHQSGQRTQPRIGFSQTGANAMNAKLTVGIALTLATLAAGAVMPTPASAACKNWSIPLAGAAGSTKVSELLHAAAPTDSQGDDVSIVGLWHVLFVSGGQPFDEGYDVWHSDGTEILNDTAPPQPANGAGTICLGVYKKTGLLSYKLRHPFWMFDATATLVGTGVFLENVTLSLTGNSYSGSFEFITYDLNGNPTFNTTGEIRAERITVD